MASAENIVVNSSQSNLQRQNLNELDVTKLTALSPEVISRQATINIGTIGHVAHGKSTVVKAISGVQTVRFKNELERNITIKLDRVQFDANGNICWPEELRHVKVHFPETYDEMTIADDTTSRGTKRKLPAYFHNRAITYKKPKTYAKEYVVEKIIDHRIVPNGGQQLFLVKWEGYSDDQNTWEPFEHLEHCPNKLAQFFAEHVTNKVIDALLDRFKVTSPSIGNIDLTKLPDKVLLQQHILRLVATPPKERQIHKLEKGKKAIQLYQIIVHREMQLTKLKEWEAYLNRQATEEAPITVENDVDLEGPPENFIYINEYVAGKNVTIPTTPERGCKCEWIDNCGPGKKGCCGEQQMNGFTYRKNKKINIIPGMAIYECNKLCKCGPNCRNRVIQNGRKIPLCIFRTKNGCGWGVKAMRRIFAGDFICEYVGEVITHEEAEERGQRYDAQGLTYLFDLDYDTKDNPYTVDAARYGNISHFINHSCDPNIAVFAAWINCSDNNLPQLALFAIKDIHKGEELTFDYMTNNTSCSPEKRIKLQTPEKPQPLDDSDSSSSKSVSCKCAADNCRRYLF